MQQLLVIKICSGDKPAWHWYRTALLVEGQPTSERDLSGDLRLKGYVEHGESQASPGETGSEMSVWNIIFNPYCCYYRV